MTRHLVSLADLTIDDLDRLTGRSEAISRERGMARGSLAGKIVGIYFQHTSTRTRTAFSAAALKMGASIVNYGPDDLQINTGESMEDTARVLGGMLDAIVIRHGSANMEDLCVWTKNAGSMSLINAMCVEEHPTQALADIAILRSTFGRTAGLRVLYMGEGNNTAVALALSCAMAGVNLTLCTPARYGIEQQTLEYAQSLAVGNVVSQMHGVDRLPDEVDVVYTTRWQTTGTSKSDPEWRRNFSMFQVDDRIMSRYPDAYFMHDLPAHRGEEVTSSVMDGPRSIAFKQAEFKLYSAMATLEWILT